MRSKKGLLFLLFLALLLCGCASRPEDHEETGKLNIVATGFVPYDLARQLAGDSARITMLLKPGTEAHTYEPAPRDMIAIETCDLFLYVGGESEDWVKQVLSGAENFQGQTFALTDCVDLLEEEITDGMYEPGGKADGSSSRREPDEHVWTSPVNVMTIAGQLCRTLQELAPEQAGLYERNLKAYLGQLQKLDARFRKIVAEGKRSVIFFGDRFPFRYFAEEYGLTYYAAFPGCSSESEPSAASVIRLIQIIREQQIPVVFQLEMSSGKIADTLCQETGAKKAVFHSCHTVTLEEFESGETYVSLMEKNAKQLEAALR